MSSEFDTEQFIAHLTEKWKGRSCPMCGTAEWKVQPSVFQISQHSDKGVIIGGVPLIPLIPVTCSNCGNTLLVNAVVSGVLAPDGSVKQAALPEQADGNR